MPMPVRGLREQKYELQLAGATATPLSTSSGMPPTESITPAHPNDHVSRTIWPFSACFTAAAPAPVRPAESTTVPGFTAIRLVAHRSRSTA